MNTIFDNLNGNIDLSIFGKSNTDPKKPLRRHYLSLVGLLEYVDIVNGDISDRDLPKGMTADDVKRMVSHSIGDLDTKQAMAGTQGTQGTQGTHQGKTEAPSKPLEGTQGTQEPRKPIDGAQGIQGTQGIQDINPKIIGGIQGTEGNEGTQGTQGNEGTEGTQGN